MFAMCILYRNNISLLGHLKEDDHEEELMRLTCADAALGWMSPPVPAADCDLLEVRVHPRFGVVVVRNGKNRRGGCGDPLPPASAAACPTDHCAEKIRYQGCV